MPKENPVIAFLNKMADLILLNLIFLLCCIPVVTIGPAITALYAVSLRSVRYGDGYVIQTFFRSFKQNFKQSFVTIQSGYHGDTENAVCLASGTGGNDRLTFCVPAFY